MISSSRSWLTSALLRKRLAHIDSRRAEHDAHCGAEEIERRQLAAFNSVWERARTGRAFYRAWQKRHELPDSVRTVQELAAFPVLTKRDLTDNEDLVFAESRTDSVYSTGGSTGEPTRFPAARFERFDRYMDTYMARAWWGLGPLERTALIWGHSHLYGTGSARYIRMLERQARDLLTSKRRLDGYLVSDQATTENIESILRYQPTLIVGYASSLFRIAASADRRQIASLHKLPIKAVIPTAEATSPAEADLMQRVFGAPVVIEYGAAETGVIAYSRHETRNIEVLWSSFFVQLDAADSVLISTLRPRQFPLINYHLGDRATAKTFGCARNVLTFSSIEGRSHDTVSFADRNGRALTVIAIQPVHVLKSFPGVRSVQFRQDGATEATIFVDLRNEEALPSLKAHFDKQMVQDHPGFEPASATLVVDHEQQRTKAGKHRLFRET